jgi:redox-sensing transcriptional repressor
LTARPTLVPDFVSLPLPTIKRLPRYLEILKERSAAGDEWLSSEALSRRLGLTAIQVRKDLALTRAPAAPKRGFRVEETAAIIADILGAHSLTGVFLIGAGSRGEAACEDDSLRDRGFKIVAVFDPSPELEARTLCGFKVLPISEMPDLVRRMGVNVALLAVRESRYPGCARLAALAGIRGIVNLSGEAPEGCEDIVVQQEDLGFQLASVARELDRRRKAGA